MKRIGIIPINEGIGGGLVTAMLAVTAAEGSKNNGQGRITAVELGRGNLYDQLCVDRWFSLRPMVFYENCLRSGGQVERIANPRGGVNWLLRAPDNEEKELTREQMVKLIYSLPGDTAFLDFSSVTIDEQFYLLEDMDEVVAIVDPMPSKLLAGYERFYRLKLWERSIFWIVNRWNDGAEIREINSFLSLGHGWTTLPEIRREVLCRAEYGGRPFTEDPQVKEAMQPALEAVLSWLAL